MSFKLFVLLFVAFDLLLKLGPYFVRLSVELVSGHVESIGGLFVPLIRVCQGLLEFLDLFLGCLQLLADDLTCFVVLFPHVCHFVSSHFKLLLQILVFCHRFLKFLAALLEILGQLQQLLLLLQEQTVFLFETAFKLLL